jgi:hypothetical protein
MTLTESKGEIIKPKDKKTITCYYAMKHVKREVSEARLTQLLYKSSADIPPTHVDDEGKLFPFQMIYEKGF